LGIDHHSTESIDLTFREAQGVVDAWVREHGGYWSPLSILAQITEEAGEIARLVNHLHGEKPKKDNEIVQELGVELCDLLYAVICLANVEGIDLQQSFEEMLAKYDSRDKDRFSFHGQTYD
jgi:NTP pyrophosphatase (non-canonical NTP hydrolase)